MAVCRTSASRAFRQTASTCSIGRSRCSISVVLGRAAHRRPRVPPRRNDQNGRRAPSYALPEQRPELGDPRLAAERNLDDLEGERTLPEEEPARVVSDRDVAGFEVIEHGDEQRLGFSGCGLNRPTYMECVCGRDLAYAL